MSRRKSVQQQLDLLAPVTEPPIDLPGDPLSLERNLALMAGAGAGKTFSLITICLHLLSGARSGRQALRTSQLYLMTFTDKAAGELRGRLRQRVEQLAAGTDQDDLVLRASFTRLGRPFPPPDFWKAVRDDLGASFIGTFHSLCAQLLRRAPAGFGVDPAFELLDERAGSALIRDAAERVVLAALEREDPQVSELCRELRFIGGGRSEGLVEQVCRIYGKIREEGLSPAELAISSVEQTRQELSDRIAELQRVAAEAIALNENPKFKEPLAVCQRGLSGLSAENFSQPDRFPLLEATVTATRVPSKDSDFKRAVQALKVGIRGESSAPSLEMYWASCFAADHEQAFRALLVDLGTRHREALEKQGALDFSELLVRSRDLLRDHGSVRREVQDRIGALLVDEFQDTNRLQLELVTLLAEQREGAPRQVQTGEQVLGLPLEPAFLCAVGDRKQSIYEFRGADVSVFEVLARHLEREGGGRSFLQTNHRSTPGLLHFFNRTFRELMRPKPDGRDYEVSYLPEGDDLFPRRKEVLSPPCVERILFEPADSIDECRVLEADALALRLQQLLAPGAPDTVVDRDGTARPARGGDVAILFRAFTHVELYRQALTRHGIPHRIVRGRGFYAAQEVLDLASLLSVVADPEDGIALAAVLRSPLVALTDASLFRLAFLGGRRLTWPHLARVDASALALCAREQQDLGRFLQLHRQLRAERDRLGVRELLRVALEATGYRLALAGAPFGEQALANVDKLLELAARWDRAGSGGCEAFSRELVALASENPREAQAELLDSADPRAVQLLTIHQSKGLEWPIVVVPDLAARPQPIGGDVLFVRDEGLAVRPVLPGGGKRDSLRLRRLRAELTRRQTAEHQRLLYVALTRARERLVLSGQAPQPQGWRKSLDAVVEAAPELRAYFLDIPASGLLPQEALPPSFEASAADQERVEAAVQRVRGNTPLRPAAAVFPVTALQDYFLCPRRYLYVHQVGLGEFPQAYVAEPEPATGDREGALDPRQRGTLAHRLLEQVDFSQLAAPGQRRAQLEALLWAEGLDPADPGAQPLLAAVESFLSTRFARQLAGLEPGRIHRELPFLLRLGGGEGGLALHLKGQIDLLVEAADGSAVLVDYKHSRAHPNGVDAYAFQLDCYALAARHFVHEGVSVRTGIAFLREPGEEPRLRPPSEGAELARFEERLMSGAHGLLECTRTNEWSGSDPSHCDQIHCGYRYRCHGRGHGL